MRILIVLALLLLCSPAQIFSQVYEGQTYNQQKIIIDKASTFDFRTSFLWPSVIFEKSLGEKLSALAELSLDISLIDDVFKPSPSLEGRYYYDIKSRQRDGKDIAGFSANYFTIGTRYMDPYTSLFAGWGIQRTRESGFFYNLLIGANYYIGFQEEGLPVLPRVNLNIGYNFGTLFRK